MAIVSPFWLIRTPASLAWFIMGNTYLNLPTYGTVNLFFIAVLRLTSNAEKVLRRLTWVALAVLLVLATYLVWDVTKDDINAHMGPYPLGAFSSPMYLDFALFNAVCLGLAIVFRDFHLPFSYDKSRDRSSRWGSDWKYLLALVAVAILYSGLNFLLTGVLRGLPIAVLFSFMVLALLLELFKSLRTKLCLVIAFPVTILLTWLFDDYLPFLFTPTMRYLEFTNYYLENQIAVRPANLIPVSVALALLFYLVYWPKSRFIKGQDFLTKS